MKPISKFFSEVRYFTALAFLCGVSAIFTGCSKGSDAAPSQADQVKATLMASPWKIKTMTVDGVDKTSLFTNFSITFSATGYTTTKGGPVWPTTDSWSFTDASATAFNRGDGITVQLLEATTSSLKMSFAWNKNTFGPGRVESVSGQTVFAMGH